MPGEPTPIGPFKGGLNNAARIGEFIEDDELFDLVNLEVDVNETLVNRPAIKRINVSGGVGDQYLLGHFKDVSGKDFLLNLNNVQADGSGTMDMYDPVTGGKMSSAAVSINTLAAIQWRDKMWVVGRVAGTGGYWSYSGTAWSWTAVAAMPMGENVAVYRNRLIIGAGIGSTQDASRIWISNDKDGTLWNWTANPWVEIDSGNGEKLTAMIGMANDMLLFKEHSTYRFGWSTDPAQAELSKISSTIGCPNSACVTTYDNNNVYLLHGDSVYELFNYSFTKISTKISLKQTLDNTLRATELFGLTMFRDRLFVRYYAYIYVYNVKTQAWCRWETLRKFSKLTIIPSTTVGLDYAYAHPADSGQVSLYFFQDDRVSGVGGTGSLGEAFNCSIISKTYDFDIPYKFKKQFWWAAVIATSGNTTFTTTIPNAMEQITWDYAKAAYKWQDGVAIPVTWGDSGDLVITEVVQPTLGRYFRKIIKLEQALRFRQVIYALSTVAISNSYSDASVRIYQLTTFLQEKETIVKKVS